MKILIMVGYWSFPNTMRNLSALHNNVIYKTVNFMVSHVLSIYSS